MSPPPASLGASDLLDPRDAAPAARARLHAWLALQRHAAYRPAHAKACLERGQGPVETLAALGGGRTPARVLPEADLARACELLIRHGARIVPFGSALYPLRIATLRDAAPVLAVRGDPGVLAGPFVAIVGARVPTRLGTELAFELARELAANGVGIVSGLALGIDAAAHRGAIAAHGTTVAMLGCGPGALVSDAYMMGIEPVTQRQRMDEALDAIMALLRCDGPVTMKTDWFELREARLADGDDRDLRAREDAVRDDEGEDDRELREDLVQGNLHAGVITRPAGLRRSVRAAARSPGRLLPAGDLRAPAARPT